MAQCYAYTSRSQMDKNGSRKHWKHLFAIRRLFIVATVIGTFALPTQAHPACKYKQEPTGGFAVYVSNGSSQNVPWGGYHVTMTHFKTSQANKDSAMGKAWQGVSALGPKALSLKTKTVNKNYWAQKIGCTNWGIVFKSKALSDFGHNLSKPEFGKFAVERGTQSKVCTPIDQCFHISLYQNSKAHALTFFKTHLQAQPWLPFLVPSPPESCQLEGINCPKWPPSPVRPKLAD